MLPITFCWLWIKHDVKIRVVEKRSIHKSKLFAFFSFKNLRGHRHCIKLLNQTTQHSTSDKSHGLTNNVQR